MSSTDFELNYRFKEQPTYSLTTIIGTSGYEIKGLFFECQMLMRIEDENLRCDTKLSFHHFDGPLNRVPSA